MSATILRNPPSIAFNRTRDVQIELQTDLIDNTQSSNFLFTYASALLRPQTGDVLTLGWAGHSVALSVVNTPSATSPQLRHNAYMWELAEFFRNLPDIESDFTITEVSTTVLKLTYRGSQSDAVLTVTGSFTNVTIVPTSISMPYLQPNLTGYLKIYGNQNQLIGCPLSANYDVSTSVATFDIHDFFSFLEHTPPLFDTLDVIESAFTHYYLRFADRYGFPAQIEQLQRSNNYTMLCGSQTPFTSTHAAIIQLWDDVANVEVMTTQPNWLYIYTLSNFSEVQARLTLYYSDGTTTNEVRDLADLWSHQVYALPCGFSQLALTDTSQGSVCLVRYTYALFGIVEQIQGQPVPVTSDIGLVTQKTFTLSDAYWHPWNTYLLVENDCGGCDSIRLYGKKQRKLKAERTIVENADGDLSAIFPQVRTTFDVSTGFYPLAYIEYLKRLLSNRMWLISDNQTFTPIVADSEGFDIEVDDTDLFALNFAFRIAAVSF